MNLLLVDKLAESYFFEEGHPKFDSLVHLEGDRICIGMANGPRGVGRLEKTGEGVVEITSICWEKKPPQSPPILDLVIGLPRPAEVRRILLLVGQWGIRSMRFVILDRTPSGYSTSKALESDSVSRALREGTEQAFHTRIPCYRPPICFRELCEQMDSSTTVLDPYRGAGLLGKTGIACNDCGLLVLGGERGFSKREQQAIGESGAQLKHLGPIIFRSEAALATAFTLIFQPSGFMDSQEAACIRIP